MPRPHRNMPLYSAWMLVIALAVATPSTFAAKKKKVPRPTDAEGLLEQVDRALDNKVSIILKEASVCDIALLVKMQVGVPVLVDRHALDDVGLDTEAKLINGGYNNVSLRCMLMSALNDCELTWQVKDGALVITTPETAESQLTTKVYPVADLVRVSEGPFSHGHDFDSLIRMLTSTIAPHSWDEVGGPGTIQPYRDTLTVSHTQDVQRTIRLTLAAIRRARRWADDHRAAAPPIQSTGLNDADSDRIVKALSQTTKFAFVETRLADVAAWIQKKHRVPVLMDPRAMDEIGISTDVPVTLALERVTLRQALSHLLKPLDMTWIIREGALVLTTLEAAENRLQLRAYPIADLLTRRESLEGDFSVEPNPVTADDLTETLQTVIAPETWDMMGGPASSPTHPTIDVLLISQTAQVHERIEHYFMKLRTTLGLIKRAPNPFKKRHDNPFGEDSESQADRANPFGLGNDPFADDSDGGDDPNDPTDPFADPPKSQSNQNDPFGGDTESSGDDPFADSANGESPDNNPFDADAESHADNDPFASDDSTEHTDQEDSANPFGDVSSRPFKNPFQDEDSPAASNANRANRGAKAKRSESKQGQRAKRNQELRFVVYFMWGSWSSDPGCFSTIPVVGSTGSHGDTLKDQASTTLHQMGGGTTPQIQQPAVPPLDSNELLDIIQELIAPDSWALREGVYARAFGHRILIRHDDSVHKEIYGLLRRLNISFHTSQESVGGNGSGSGKGLIGGMSGGMFSVEGVR